MVFENTCRRSPQREHLATARAATLSFTVRRHNEVTVVGVQGQVDAANTEHLADVLTQFLRVRSGLVVDLEQLQFCSVAGLEFFIYFDRRCRGARCPWVLLPGLSLRRLVLLSGEWLPAAVSLEEATNLLNAAGARRPALKIAT